MNEDTRGEDSQYVDPLATALKDGRLFSNGTTTIVRCAKCGVRRGTETWAKDGFALTHGMYQLRCKPCVYEAQLAHARQMAAEIPALEARLMEALAESETLDAVARTDGRVTGGPRA